VTSDGPVTYERAGNIARIIPAIHYAHLPRIVGRHRAFELLFTGRVFSAMEARELGLVNRVVGDAELEPEVVKLAAQFAEKSAAVLRMGRAAFMRQIALDYRRSIASAVDDFCNVGRGAGGPEGVRGEAAAEMVRTAASGGLVDGGRRIRRRIFRHRDHE